MKALLRTLSLIAAATMIPAAFVRAQPATPPPAGDSIAAFGGIRVGTRASRDATLSFTFPVEIKQVLVHGGQRVHKGGLLIQGQDDETRAQRDLQKSQAESDLDVQKAQVAVDQAQIEFSAQEKLSEKKSGGSPIELDRAKAVLASKKVELEIAKLQRVQALIQLAVREAQLDRFSIKAPFDGIVDNVLVEVGEVKKDTEPVLKIVSTDPLWMDVNAPIEQTISLALKPGDRAWVFLDLPGEPSVSVGKVIEVGAQGDFAGGTRRVRVELPNPNDWPAGVAAWVRFTQPEGEWSKRVKTPDQKRAAAVPKDRPATPTDQGS